jgi:ferritin-like metal-binding protein YciE
MPASPTVGSRHSDAAADQGAFKRLLQETPGQIERLQQVCSLAEKCVAGIFKESTVREEK